MSEPPIPPTDPSPAIEGKADDRGVPPASPIEGKTAIDEALTFESAVLAHRSASVLAARIADQVVAAAEGRSPCTIYFLDETLALALGLHRTFYQQCEVLGRTFDAATERAERGLSMSRKRRSREKDTEEGTRIKAAGIAAGGIVTAATSALAVATNLLSYFNVDTSYFGREAKVGQQALVMELARRLLPHEGISFRWPSLGAAAASVASRGVEAPAPLHALNSVAEKQERAFAAIHDLATIVHQMADDDPRLPVGRLALGRAHAAHDSAAAVFDELRDSFLAAHGKSETSPAFLLQLAADILQETPESLADTPEHDDKKVPAEVRPQQRLFLTARIEASGGSYRIRKHIFQSLTGKDPLSFTGGSIASFALLDSDGDFLAAGTEWHREPFLDDAELCHLLERRDTRAC